MKKMNLKENDIFQEVFKDDISAAGSNYCEECLFRNAELGKRAAFVKLLLKRSTQEFLKFCKSYRALSNDMRFELEDFNRSIYNKKFLKLNFNKVYLFEFELSKYNFTIFKTHRRRFFENLKINRARKYFRKLCQENDYKEI